MIEFLFGILAQFDRIFWEYIGFTLVLAAGVYFTFITHGYQFTTLRHAATNIKALMHDHDPNDRGAHPIRLYFASVGGMVGLGNLVAVVTAVTIGGPGSVFWLWVASFSGMLIKYSEIYLGLKYRVHNDHDGYDGGPMYYLQAAFKSKFLPIIVCVLLCIYGVEVSQFLILTDTFSKGYSINRWLVIGVLLAAVLYVGFGGVKRLADVCTILMPPFMLLYIGMCFWVIGHHFSELLHIIPVIFKSAFAGHAAVGGFAGSTLLVAAQYGTARAVYSGDIGIGYDSIVQSESRVKSPARQARVAVFSLANDTFICTLSCLVLLVTGLWTSTDGLLPSEYIPTALGMYFPHIGIFMLVLFFLAGFTTIVGYFVVGLKCARFLHAKYGQRLYIAYAIIAFVAFSFCDQASVMLIMSSSGGLLMLCNLLGVWKLRREIKFR
jgi:AGCS family alanine or glycine:cation symporter